MCLLTIFDPAQRTWGHFSPKASSASGRWGNSRRGAPGPCLLGGCSIRVGCWSGVCAACCACSGHHARHRRANSTMPAGNWACRRSARIRSNCSGGYCGRCFRTRARLSPVLRNARQAGDFSRSSGDRKKKAGSCGPRGGPLILLLTMRGPSLDGGDMHSARRGQPLGAGPSHFSASVRLAQRRLHRARADQIGKEARPFFQRLALLRQPVPDIIGRDDAGAAMRKHGFGDIVLDPKARQR